MTASIFSTRAQTLNAKIGAVTLAVGALLTLILSHTPEALAPLRVIAMAIAAFAVWAFSDEMGVRKPLNRAGFVLFSIAAFTKVQIVLGVEQHLVGRYLLLYAAFLLLAVLFWSLALLHRQRGLKVVGAVGLFATAVPIAAIVIGHIAAGVGAALGVSGMLAASQGAAPGDTSFVTMVERIFGLWSYVAAWLLWRGHIVNLANQDGSY
jgi:hypothetical protein